MSDIIKRFDCMFTTSNYAHSQTFATDRVGYTEVPFKSPCPPWRAETVRHRLQIWIWPAEEGRPAYGGLPACRLGCRRYSAGAELLRLRFHKRGRPLSARSRPTTGRTRPRTLSLERNPRD